MPHRFPAVILVCLILSLCTLSAAASADPGSLWQSSSYPSDVSYAYCTGTTDGIAQWEIGLVGADAERHKELRAQFPSCNLTFTECVASFSERTAILTDILSSGEEGIISGVLLQDSEEILILAENSKASRYASLYQREYGSLVIVMNQDGVIPGNADSPTISIKTLIVILAAAAFVIIFTNRYTKLKKSRLDSDV